MVRWAFVGLVGWGCLAAAGTVGGCAAGSAPGPGGLGCSGGSSGSHGGSSSGSSGGVSSSGGASGGGKGTAGCGETLAPLSDYTQNGPFGTTTINNSGPDGGYTVVQPSTLGQNGFKHPIAT